MKKTTVLCMATIIMIILNCVLLFTLYTKSGNVSTGLPHPEPKQIIIDKLQFSREQIIRYDELIKRHRRSINNLDSEIRTTKVKLYSLLSEDEKQHERDSLIAEINGYQRKIEYIHFKHFEDIKNLCTDEQKVLFAQLVLDLPRHFGSKPPMPPPGRHGRHERPEDRP